MPFPELTRKICQFFPMSLIAVQSDVAHIGIPYLLQIKTYLWQRTAVVESLTFVINFSLTPPVMTDCSARSKHAQRSPLSTPLGDHPPSLRSPTSQLLQEGNDTIGCKCSLTNDKFILALVFCSDVFQESQNFVPLQCNFTCCMQNFQWCSLE